VYALSKKIIILLILIIGVFSVYGSYYVYASTVLVPEDLKVFKSDLDKMDSSNPPTYNETLIKQGEANIAKMENGPSLTLIPPNQRHSMANRMRNENANPNIDELKHNITRENARAFKYDLMLRGNIANEIRSVYNPDIIPLLEEMISTQEKIAVDFENGDNKAYVADIKKINELGKKYYNLTINSKTQLQDIVKQLT
jgi:hypothetical protein